MLSHKASISEQGAGAFRQVIEFCYTAGNQRLLRLRQTSIEQRNLFAVLPPDLGTVRLIGWYGNVVWQLFSSSHNEKTSKYRHIT